MLAFLASTFSCQSEALLASAWNLPFLALVKRKEVFFKSQDLTSPRLQKCSDLTLSNKARYPTFLRMQPPTEKIAKSIIAVLEHFHWNRVVVVSATGTVYSPINTAFQVGVCWVDNLLIVSLLLHAGVGFV